MQIDDGSTLARMENYLGACKDWTDTRVSNMPHTGCPHADFGLPQACTNAHMHMRYCSFLSAPCRRLPGATSGTNKRDCTSVQASHCQRVRCDLLLSLVVVCALPRATSMADARIIECGCGCSLDPVVQLRLQLIRIWALSFQPQTATVPLALDCKVRVRLFDHSA